ncbi:hypothetical protein D5W64_12610 [Salmonella enterica subsp. enterica serovar Saintpaul]|nr:hypothetical protein [Salmonella enterica subsp. enterica serovar Saintpaul]
MIPFSVNDPITGTDITKDVRLTAIEVGGQPSPYLKPNGDYSFTVVGANETDLTEEVTFKLDVDWEGQPYPLEAKTDITVKGTTASQLVVRIVGSFDGHERVLLTNGFMVQFQVSYHGRLLGAGEIGVNNTVNTNAGLGIEYKGVLEDGVTHRMDVTGKALGDSLWFMVHVFRPEEPAKTVVLQGYADVVSPNANDLRIWIEPRYRSINGVKGDKQIVFCKYYRGVYPVAYNAAGMSVQLAGNVGSDDAGVKFIEALPEGLVGEFLPDVTVKTNYTMNVVMVYNGVTARAGTTWSCHPDPTNVGTQFGISPKYPVLANSDENFVWQVGELNLPNIFDDSNRPTSKGGMIISGDLVGYDVTAALNLFKEPLNNVSLNSLRQFSTRHAVDYRKQTYNVQDIVMKARFEAETPLWERQWQYCNIQAWGVMIEEAPYTFKASSDVITGVTGRSPTIYITATQDRGNGPEVINGMFSAVTVTGAASYKTLYNLEGNLGVLSMNARGLTGDVLIKGTFTTTDTPAQVKTFELTIQADNALDIDIPYQNLSAKVWDVYTQFPMIIKSGATDVSANVVDFRIIDNDYVKSLNTEPYSWEITKGLTSSSIRVNTYFLFTLELDGQRYDLIDFLDYTIAQFTGKTFTSTADYGEGLGVTTGIKVGQCIENGFTVYPVYKGKPKTDGISAVITTSGWFSNVPCKVHSITEDGLGINYVYDAPCTGTIGTTVPANVILTVDGTPGTTADVNKWTGSFTLTIINGSGLYIAPITLTPSSQQLGKALTWNSGIYLKAKRILPTDPDLKLEVKAAADALNLKIVGYSGYNVYFAFISHVPSSTVIRNYLVGTHTLGGSSGNVPLNAGYSGSQGLPITMMVNGTANGSAENIVPVQFIRNGADVGKANIVYSAFGHDVPENGNALLGELELIDDPNDPTHNALKFSSGWTGGTVYPELVLGFTGLTDPWYIRDAAIPILPAPITIAQTVNDIDGVDGRTTEIQFTMSQQRIDDTGTIKYTFSTATIAPTGTVTGSIKGAYDATNNNGTFSVVLHGNGTQGPGTATLTVTDPDGFEYPVTLNVEAVIDSSLLVMTPITPSSVTGKAGTVTTMSGVTTYNGSTVVGWDNGSGNVHYSIEPEGWVEFVNPTKDNFDLKITRNSDVDISQEVFVVCNFLGMIAKQPVMVNVVKNMDTNAIVQNVEVWGRYTGYPFVVKAGEEDITSTILDAKPVNDNLVIPIKMENKNKPAVNMWTIKGVDYANDPARTEVVTWQYRLPTDAADTVRTIDVVYNIAKYTGYSLTYTTSKPYYTGLPLSQFQADFFVYRYAEPITDRPVNDGPINSPALSSNGYTNFDGQGRYQFQVINNAALIDTYGVSNTFSVRVGTGYIDGHNKLAINFITNIYNPNNNSSLSDFQPNPLVGKFGEEIHATVKVWRNGNPNELTQANLKDPIFTPTGIMEMVPGTRNNDGFLVRFIADIDVNSKETEVTIRMPYATETGGSTKFIAKQMATNLKLTQAPGFQTSGSGDMENPVTLTQSVLNPE